MVVGLRVDWFGIVMAASGRKAREQWSCFPPTTVSPREEETETQGDKHGAKTMTRTR